MDNWKKRTELLVGESGINKLSNSSVCVFGIGGVGGYVCEMLVRAGIENITIVDFDKVDETNINRQIIATTLTIGKNKCDVMRDRLKSINQNVVVDAKNVKFGEETIDFCFDKHYDFVVDAIDMVKNKTLLISYCKSNNIPIISAMGAGNRVGVPKFEIGDIFKAYNDGLAKVMRKNLKNLGINKHICAYTTELASANNNSTDIGSISYYPAMCGCVISAYVVNELLK